MSETKTKLLRSWLSSEHARLHIVAAWPDSARKEALLIAIRSSIRRLMIDQETASFTCLVCRTAGPVTVLPFSQRRRPDVHCMAA
jgi:hypothetical protein